MVTEASTWRLMVAPIRGSTGINTKLFTALELGIPLVLTPAAAKPFRLLINSSAALIASSEEGMTNAVIRAYKSQSLWKRLKARVSHDASGARQAFSAMLLSDPSSSDLAHLLATACVSQHGPRTPYQRDLTLSLPSAARDGGSRGWKELLPATMGGAVGRRDVSECFRERAATLHRMWWRLCAHCKLKCSEHPQQLEDLSKLPHRPATHANGFRSVPTDADVWMDAQWSPELSAFQPLTSPYKLLRFSHDLPPSPSPEPPSVVASLSLPLPIRSCGRNGDLPLRITAAVRELGGVDDVWRRAFAFAGLQPWAVDLGVRFAREESERMYNTVKP
ncbi:MAG: hypothetical protein SGPRY_010508 [Prymnesium sp.]